MNNTNNESKEKKILSPKVDVVFQALFGEIGSERITKSFLESILKEKIDSIDLSKNQILRREEFNGKLGILDVVAKINGKENCNIELQIAKQNAIVDRILYYWGRVYTRQIKESDEYDSLERTIQILITDFEIKGLEELEYCTKWKIIEDNERKQILTEKFEIDIIQMPKIKEDSGNDKLLDWLYFIENPKSERVIEKMQENEELKEAGDKLDNLSDDEMMQRIADLREKAIRDEKACYNTAYSEGIERGIEQGIEQNQKDIVIEMLKNNMDIDTIIKITKIDKSKIEEIKKDLNIK